MSEDQFKIILSQSKENFKQINNPPIVIYNPRKKTVSVRYDFALGLIKEWARSLEIPEGSALREELARFSREDLAQGKPEERFPALNALRLLLSSLEKSPWRSESFTQTSGSGRRSIDRKNPKGWT